MESFSVQCLGTGDGMACADRNHSSYLYRFGETSILIDCGEPVSRSFQGLKLGWDTVDRIFLSHLHSDHIGGLFMLLQGFWLGQRSKPLPIHLPADGIEPIRQMLKAAYLFDELFRFDLSMKPIKAGVEVLDAGVRVTPFPTTHLEGFRKTFQAKYPGNYAAYSFLLEAGQRRIIHSADLGAVEDLDPLLAKPVDLLVCELSHFTPRHLFEYLKDRPVGQIVFTHLGHEYWENLADTRRLAETMLPQTQFSFARDHEVFTL